MKTESSRPTVTMGLRGKLALLVLFCAVPGFGYLLPKLRDVRAALAQLCQTRMTGA
jgi:hypothetical protein